MRKLPVLKVNELRKEVFAGPKCLYPVSKFGQVLFVYRLPAVTARQGQVQFDQPYCVTVVP